MYYGEHLMKIPFYKSLKKAYYYPETSHPEKKAIDV